MDQQTRAETGSRTLQMGGARRITSNSAELPIRILLVLPDGKIHKLKLGPLTMSFREAPLTLTSLAALIPADMNTHVVIVDESVGTRIPYEETFDLVGISCITGTAPRAYEIAEYLHEEEHNGGARWFSCNPSPRRGKTACPFRCAGLCRRNVATIASRF